VLDFDEGVNVQRLLDQMFGRPDPMKTPTHEDRAEAGPEVRTD
jgi:hypothetical protein